VEDIGEPAVRLDETVRLRLGRYEPHGGRQRPGLERRLAHATRRNGARRFRFGSRKFPRFADERLFPVS
jgi:hypothetical protein